MRKIHIFYHNYRPEPRADQLKKAAQKHGLDVRLIIANDLVFRDSAVYYKSKKLSFNKNDLYWAISSTLTLDTLAYIATLSDAKVYPLHGASLFIDKYRTQCFFNAINIPTPKTVLISTLDFEKNVKDIGAYPLVIKKTHSSAGKAVELVRSPEEITQFITENQQIKKVPLKINAFILQEFVEESAGSDFRVLCIQKHVLGIIKRTASKGFKSNYSLGGNVEHIKSDPELEKMALKIMDKTGLFMAGIDFIQSNNGYLAIEINPSPQFGGFEKASQIDVADEIITTLLKQ